VVKFKGIKHLEDKSIYEKMIYGDTTREVKVEDIRLFRDLWSDKGQVNLKLNYEMSLKSRKMIFKEKY